MLFGSCSCGDGTLDIPPQKGDNNDCENMKLLLKQHQRVIITIYLWRVVCYFYSKLEVATKTNDYYMSSLCSQSLIRWIKFEFGIIVF